METQDVNIDAGKSTPLDVKLEATGGNVAGPFGDVALKGDPRAAVLSNGTTPDYFVGHVDEFELRLDLAPESPAPARKHHLTVTHEGKTIWSGDVDVEANKKNRSSEQEGKEKTSDWQRGEKLKDVPRFKAGTASAQVAVAPVTGNFSVATGNINCGQTATLNWQTGETVDANISGIGKVQPSGNQSVSRTPPPTTTSAPPAPAEPSKAPAQST